MVRYWRAIVVGGPTFCMQGILTPGHTDVAVVGDGEEPFLEICQAVDAGWGSEEIPGVFRASGSWSRPRRGT